MRRKSMASVVIGLVVFTLSGIALGKVEISGLFMK